MGIDARIGELVCTADTGSCGPELGLEFDRSACMVARSGVDKLRPYKERKGGSRGCWICRLVTRLDRWLIVVVLLRRLGLVVSLRWMGGNVRLRLLMFVVRTW